MKRLLLSLLLIPFAVQANNDTKIQALTFATILDKDRGYTDVIPLDICYLPSLFSVRHQMTRYGIALPFSSEGTGYEFAQLATPVYKQVSELLHELNFDIQSAYILKLHPAWKNATTTVIATNACLFIDEEEWLALDSPYFKEQFTHLAQLHDWDVADPIKEIKKYILKRALVHHTQGTYRKKVASKLIVGAALGFIAYKTMSQVNEYISEKDAELGISDALCDAAPGVTRWCSTLCITAFAKWWASITVSSIIGDQIRGAFHTAFASPYWSHLDSTVEYKAVAQAPLGHKKLFASYNASQALWKKDNQVLNQEYNKRTALLTHLSFT